VAAGVVKSVQLAITVACHDDLLRTYPCDEIIALQRDLLRSANGNPLAIPDGVELTLVVIAVDIPAGWQGWLNSR